MLEKSSKNIYQSHYLDEHLQMHKCIIKCLQNLENISYNRKKDAQKKYMKCFLVILEKIKRELQLAQESYNPIEVNRKKGQACQKMRYEVEKHKKNCLQLQSETKQAKQILNQQTRKHLILRAQKSALMSALNKKAIEKQQLQMRASHLQSSSLLASQNSQRKLKGQSLGNIFFFKKQSSLAQKNSEQMKELLQQIQIRKHDSERSRRKKWDQTESQGKSWIVNPQIADKLSEIQIYPQQAKNRLLLTVRKPYTIFRKPR